MTLKRSKIELYWHSDDTQDTPILTLYNSLWQQNPQLQLTFDDWDSMPNQSRIHFDKPATSTGGSYRDDYVSIGGKILVLNFILQSYGKPYVQSQMVSTIKSLAASNDTLDLRRVQQFPSEGKQVVDWLKDCYFTDIDSVKVPSRGKLAYGFTLTSSAKDSTTPVVTSIAVS